MAVYKPKAVYPSPPENTIVRGSAVNFLMDDGGTGHTMTAIQIAENRQDAGCQYWYLTAQNTTLTADGLFPPSTYMFANTTNTISFAASAFNSLTKNTGYRWRVKYQTASYAQSDWSDWQLFFTTASASYVTWISPVGGVANSRYLTVSWTNTGPPLIAARIVLKIGSTTTVYDQTIPMNVPADGTASFDIPYALNNGTSYTVYVTPKIYSGSWATQQSTTFLANFVRLSTPTMTVYALRDGGHQLVYTAPSVVTNPIVSNDLYRWSQQSNDYILLASDLSASFTYNDISSPINIPFWYRVVAKSTYLDDVFTTESQIASGENWFILNSSGSTRLNVVALDFSSGRSHILDQYEPLGRSFKVISRFQSSSREGSMAIDIRPEERETIIPALYNMAGDTVYILSPYGDTYTTKLTGIVVNDDIYGSAVVTINFTEEVPS